METGMRRTDGESAYRQPPGDCATAAAAPLPATPCRGAAGGRPNKHLRPRSPVCRQLTTIPQ